MKCPGEERRNSPLMPDYDLWPLRAAASLKNGRAAELNGPPPLFGQLTHMHAYLDGTEKGPFFFMCAAKRSLLRICLLLDVSAFCLVVI